MVRVDDCKRNAASRKRLYSQRRMRRQRSTYFSASSRVLKNAMVRPFLTTACCHMVRPVETTVAKAQVMVQTSIGYEARMVFRLVFMVSSVMVSSGAAR